MNKLLGLSFLILLAKPIAASDTASIPPLLEAARKGEKDMVIHLLDKKANIDQQWKEYTAISLAAHFDKSDMVRLLLERGAKYQELSWCGDTPLSIAIEYQYPKVEEAMNSQHVADIAKCYAEVLTRAARANRTEVIRNLLNRTEVLGPRKMRFLTDAFQAAIAASNFEIADQLLAKGADLEDKSLGYYKDTILHYAVRGALTPAIEYLLRIGADFRALNIQGQSPYFLAFRGQNKQIRQIFREHRAFINDEIDHFNRGHRDFNNSLAVKQCLNELIYQVLKKPEDNEKLIFLDKFLSRMTFNDFNTKLILDKFVQMVMDNNFIVANVLRKYIDINGLDKNQKTPLMRIAGEGGNQSAADYQLVAGADHRSENQNGTALSKALSCDNQGLAKKMINPRMDRTQNSSRFSNIDRNVGHDQELQQPLAGKVWHQDCFFHQILAAKCPIL